MSIFCGVPRPMFLAGLTAFAAIVLTTGSVPQSKLGSCDEDETGYMNLLQVRADKRDSGQPALSGGDTSIAIKQSHPYYHTSVELLEEAKLLSKGCGGVLTMETHTDGGVNIEVIRVRASNSTETPINRVFILFGEHSRELISPESGLRFLQVICGKVASTSKVGIPTVLLENEFQLVLNGNPHSRAKVEKGDYCLRTNPNGVDLNRNWDEMWATEGIGAGQTSPGSRPFSEPETRIFKKLAEDFKPTTFLTVHSGTRGMYMPWAYDMKHAAKFNAPLMLNVLKSLDESHCQCPYGAAGKEVGYPCPGTCLDWVYSKLKTPYVFAFEIYTSPNNDADLKQRFLDKLKDAHTEDGNLKLLQSGSHLGHMSASEQFGRLTSEFVQSKVDLASLARNDGCFSMFNPDTEARYNATVQNWADAYLEMAHMVAQELKKDMSPLNKMADTKD